VERAAVQTEVHFLVVQAHLLEDGGLQIADVMGILSSTIADLIGRATDASAARFDGLFTSSERSIHIAGIRR
jgi:hypothetical protein